MRPYVAELARIADCYVTCYPNAGLPNAFGEYDEQPADTAAALREFASSGFVNIVGGCCGTTPDHIRQIAAAVEELPPRPVEQLHHGGQRGHGGQEISEPQAAAAVSASSAAKFTQFAGLEVLTIRPDSNFQMIGERTNVTGSKRFQKLIKDGKAYVDSLSAEETRTYRGTLTEAGKASPYRNRSIDSLNRSIRIGGARRYPFDPSHASNKPNL
jgi:5-methyltetrahydrofolate--homocysteine methyltransferase